MLKARPPIEIIGAPQDLGQVLRGVDMGPSAVRVAGLVPKLESLGFDVISLGVQSFRAEGLTFLGRRHSPSEAASAVERAGLPPLNEGDKVSFEIEDDRRGRGKQAANVQMA